MKLTKEDKAMLRGEYEKAWHGSEKMVDHCVRSASGYIDFGDAMWVIDKPHIQTGFWFGEHTYDYDEVLAACNAASEDELYFKRVNHDRTRAFGMMEMLEPDEYGYVEGDAYLAMRNYASQDDDCRLGYVVVLRRGQSPEEYFATRGGMQEHRKLDEDEVEELREFLADEVEKFDKRLSAYLKRYGLSKCHFSTYWADR